MKEKQPKATLFHINSYFAGRFFYRHMYRALENQGIKQSVYVPVPQGSGLQKSDFGYEVILSENHKAYDRWWFYRKHRKIYQDLISSVDIRNVFLIHAHSLFSNGYIALRLKEDYNLPYMVTVRSADAEVFFKRLFYLRSLGVRILAEAARVVFLSPAYREKVINTYVPQALQKKIREKSLCLPNGVDPFWHARGGKPKQFKKDEVLKVLYAGEINRNKNPLATAKALRKVKDAGREVLFTVVGPVTRPDLAKKLSSYPFVKVKEPVPKEELLTLYRNHHLYVMPSFREAFGLSYAEALSQGLPVIYSKGQGFDGQFREGEVGFSVDPRRETTIQTAIVKAVADYEGLSSRSLKKARCFDWDRLARDYADLYRRIDEERQGISCTY